MHALAGYNRCWHRALLLHKASYSNTLLSCLAPTKTKDSLLEDVHLLDEHVHTVSFLFD